MSKPEVTDLRTALEFLRTEPGELVETDTPVEPNAQLSGVYRYVGAGGTVMRPTRTGPAMLFKNVKGHPDAQVVIGVLASRNRVAKLFGVAPERLGYTLLESVNNPIDPVVVSKDKAVCQEVVHLATDEDFDLFKLVPAPTNTPIQYLS